MDDVPKKSIATIVVRCCLVVGILILGGAIVIPNLKKPRITSSYNACINNLCQIDGAKDQWASESKIAAGSQPSTNGVAQYIKGNRIPSCPAGGTYSLNPIGQNPTCSIGGPGHSLP